MIITAAITDVFPQETINSRDGEKSWPKVVIWVEAQEIAGDEVNPLYPIPLELQFFGDDKVALTDGLGAGQVADFHVNLKGNKYEKNGKKGIFMGIDCWKIDSVQNGTQSQSQAQGIVDKLATGDDADLPF